MRKLLLLGLLVLCASLSAFAQSRVVTGRVVSADDGEPVLGVSILIKGTTTGVPSDIDGNFSISVPDENAVLVFRYIGFKVKEVRVGNQSKMTVNLESDERSLQEVVVTAFGVEKETRALGTSVTAVRNEELIRGRATNVANSLAGKVAGVRVQGSSGMVGASANIFIRGFTTFTGSNQPLMIVDGIPIDNGGGTNALQAGVANSNRGIDINQDDIEEMSILKGPAAAVLYGSRAAGGAIIITTKKGRPGARKANVSYTSNINFAEVNRFPDYQNSYGQGLGGNFLPANTPESWGPRIAGQQVTNFRGEQENLTAYPNNVKDLFKTGMNFQNNLSVSGASNTGDYFLSYGNLNETGILDNNQLTRNSVTFNANNRLSDRLTVGVNMIYSNNRSQRTQQGNQLANPFFRSWFMPRSFNPFANPFERPDQTQRSPANANDLVADNTWYGNDDHPLFTINRNLYNDEINRIIGSVNLSYKILDNLTFTYRLGTDTYTEETKIVNARTSRGGSAAAQTGAITDQMFRRTETTSDAILRYSERFADGEFGLSVLLGNQINQRSTRNNGVTGTNIQVIGFENITNTLQFNPFGTTSQIGLIGAFGDISMDYRNTYFISFQGRNDWSSTFGRENRSYFYPSVNSSVVLTDAIPALADNSVVSFWKIRGGWALVGREAPVFSTDSYFSRQNLGDSFGVNMLLPFNGQLGQSLNLTGGNPNLGPEFTRSWEIGTDMRLFNGRINLDATYYDQYSYDIIFGVPVSGSSGITNQFQNAGSLSSKGFEMLIGGSPIRRANFSWDVSFNYSRIRPVVGELAEGVEQITLGGFVTPSTRLIAGEPYGVFWGSYFERHANGQLLVNQDGRPILAQDNKIIGNPNPDWFGGITNTFTYKGFSLSALIDIRKGGDIISRNISDLRRTGAVVETMDRERGWIVDGVNADGSPNTIQISAQNYFNDLYGFGRAELVTFDGSWIRLREAELSYRFPSAILDRTFMGRAELGLVGRNLFLYAPNVPHIDPEVNAQGQSNSLGLEFNAMPQTRTYGAFVRVTF